MSCKFIETHGIVLTKENIIDFMLEAQRVIEAAGVPEDIAFIPIRYPTKMFGWRKGRLKKIIRYNRKHDARRARANARQETSHNGNN